jgi:Protein of unknown function (DUF1207)
MPASLRALAASVALASALLAPVTRAEERFVLRCGTGVHGGEEKGIVGLPSGGVFCPLFADPKAVRTFATYVRGKFPTGTASRHVGAVGVGDGIALVRFNGPRPGEGLQLGVEAAVFSQFALDAPSDDILNADYIASVPLTFRIRSFSARARVYHQSSHLGDELLLRPDTTVKRENLSFEAAELILSQDLGALRVYAGGEYLFHRSPATLDDLLAHAGAELRLGPSRGARLVTAVDVKSTEQQDWKPGVSARLGLEIAWWRHPDHPPRLGAVIAEFYDGPSPYGQFFLESTRYFGAGFQVQL